MRIRTMLNRSTLMMVVVASLFGCGEKESESAYWQRAREFEKQENFAEAIKVYEKQLIDYPQGEFAEEALHKVAFLNYNNVHDFAKAIELHRTLIDKYPQSEFVPQARFMIGYISANDLKDYEAAKVAYENFLKHHSGSELAESVKWELEHLGQDINEQLQELFGDDKSDGEATVK